MSMYVSCQFIAFSYLPLYINSRKLACVCIWELLVLNPCLPCLWFCVLPQSFQVNAGLISLNRAHLLVPISLVYSVLKSSHHKLSV
jgi:hypothetical protein